MKKISIILSLILFVSVANAQIVPILDLKVGGLIGGVKDGKFVKAEMTFKELKDIQEYSLLSLETGRAQDNLPLKVSAPDTPCDDFYWVSTEIETMSGIAVGANANWKILPREAKKISSTDKTYLNIVSGILKSKGLPRAKARIEQAVRVDLDGDGVEEVLISASSYQGNVQPSAKVNDYSFVLLRKIVGKKVENIMIAEEFIKKNVEFGAPSKYQVSAVADLNGDGKMEIVLYGAYYEGSQATVLELNGNKLMDVLSVGCGV